MKEILELDQWEGGELKYKYTSFSRDYLLNKELKLNKIMNTINKNGMKYDLVTSLRIKSSKKELAKGYQDEYELNVLITENEQYKCKKNKDK